MIAQLSSMKGYSRPSNQRLFLPACFGFWLVILLIYWSLSILPFEPTQAYDVQLHALVDPAEDQKSTSIQHPSNQTGYDENEPVQSQEPSPPQLEIEEPPPPPPEVIEPRDLAANETLGVSSSLLF